MEEMSVCFCAKEVTRRAPPPAIRQHTAPERAAGIRPAAVRTPMFIHHRYDNESTSSPARHPAMRGEERAQSPATPRHFVR